MQDNKDTPDISGLLIKLATKLFRMLLWLIAITASIGAVTYLNSAYEEHKELTYMTSDKCSEHDYQTQICETEDGSLYLRRIEMANNRMSVSMLVDNPEWDTFKFQYTAFWFENCDSELQMESDQHYSDGSSIALDCILEPSIYLRPPSPSRLKFSYTTPYRGAIEINYSGFKINHDYSRTDYSVLMRKHALTNKRVEKERKVRLEREAEARKVSLEKKSRERQVRITQENEERLAKKRICEEENQIASKLFSEAESTILRSDDSVVRFYCEDESKWPIKRNCTSWRYLITNPTSFDIDGFVLRYGDICGFIPENEKLISFSLPSGKTIAGSVPLDSDSGCAKITAVKFKPRRPILKACNF